MTEDPKSQAYFNEWTEREAVAEKMVPVIGGLYREKGVVITIFGRSLVRSSPIDIIKAHRFARRVLQGELAVELGAQIVEALTRMQLPASRIDIGKLASRFQNEHAGSDVEGFVRSHLADIQAARNVLSETPKDIVLYG
ncbi:MAG: hypothetical protein QF735_09145, partial [Phycisphaeraceae bacterium]|nr:hypothetical protein [Phycisphaeraceae bacterium]